MTTATDLLTAILADPDDLDIRLAYADWLDRDDAEPEERVRSEFIRVQAEVIRLRMRGAPALWSTGDPDDPKDHPYYTLRSRERELLARDYCNWMPLSWHQGSRVGTRLSETGASVEFIGSFLQGATFRYGFPDLITTTMADWMGRDCTRTIVAACPVRDVRFSDREPMEAYGTYHWTRDRGAPWSLPVEMFDRHWPSVDDCYHTAEAASDALSRAAIDRARTEAGLPARKGMTT